MGLLDFGDSPQDAGLLSLGLRLMSTPGKFGTALGQAGLGAMGDYRQAQQMQEQRKLREQQAQEQAVRQQMLQMQMQQMQQAQAEAVARRKLAESSVLSPSMVSMAQNGGPTLAAAAALPTASPGFDYRRYSEGLAAQGDVMGSLAIQQALKKEQPKLKSVEPMRDPGTGKLVNIALFEDGTTKILPYGVKPEIALQSLGNRVVALDKNDLPKNASFEMGQSPDSRAANALGRDRLTFDKQESGKAVTYQQDANGNFVGLPAKAVPGTAIRATPVMAPTGVQPLVGKGDNLTEDQAKATGWLVQATNAHKNMLAAINPKLGGDPSASQPGFPDFVAGVPSFGFGEGVANTMRGANRQKFIQGASSLSEALLRAATGAGVNKDEAVQKVKELTPVIGEDPSVTQQKMESIPLYIETLKIRAGKGAGKVDSLLTQPGVRTYNPATGRIE